MRDIKSVTYSFIGAIGFAFALPAATAGTKAVVSTTDSDNINFRINILISEVVVGVIDMLALWFSLLVGVGIGIIVNIGVEVHGL